ncbi:MAG: N-6 DNA methylase [Bacteroidales bacterium]|nr:N-6 DNA methylase [Bacteroidales bacterium]
MAEEQKQLKEGYISGEHVKASPEEVEATQVFSKILVEDYQYGKEYIITRPQHRIKKSPSDKQGYPLDITVFEDEKHTKIKMIIECKKSTEKLDEHVSQLQAYMALSNAEIGVLFNGIESKFFHKIITDDGFGFESIPAIPKFGEKLEEIGLYYKKDLKPTHNLKPVFRELKGWIKANGNEDRDDIIASQIVLLMLCKIYDERFTPLNEKVRFRASLSDTDDEISNRIHNLFISTKSKYDEVITESETILFNGKTLRGIVGRLQAFSIINTDRDCMADAFEVFIDKAVKESEGQFFTPRNVIKTIITAIDIKRNGKIIDTACGSGGFLVEALKRIEELVNEEGERCGWSDEARKEEIKAIAIKNIRGLEKDSFLTKLSKSYMAILGDGKGGIFQEDSLEQPTKWNSRTQGEIHLGSFDYLLANPPFGKNIKVEGVEKLKQYTLAYKIGKNGKSKLVESGNVSSLFLERNIQMLKIGGKLGIILPEPYFALPSYFDCIDFMIKGNCIEWIIDLPQNTFRPHNNAKCCAVIIKKGSPQGDFINMAVAQYIGHDHQGRPLLDNDGKIKDDTTQIIQEIQERQANNGVLVNNYKRQLTFQVKAQKVIESKILVPRYYWENSFALIEEDANNKGISLLSLQELIDKKVITYFSGHGSPKGDTKGLGDIPYIRVKNIVNWQPYIDVTSMIPRSEYESIFNDKKSLKPKDILYVSRGSYRIGSVAMVSPYDGEMLLTREIIVIRLNEDNNYGITPEYLLYALSHRYVWDQSQNKVFYEPCLPNIANRWVDIKIPIYNDAKVFESVKLKAKAIVEQQWKSKELMQLMRKEDDAYLI